MFPYVKQVRGFVILPKEYLKDDRLSMGAKGLYGCLYALKDDMNSLADFCQVTSSDEEELKGWFDELWKCGYLVDDKGKAVLVDIPKSARVVAKNLDEDTIQKHAEETVEKPKSKYDKILDIVNSYDFSENLKNLMMTYFEERLNSRGAFAGRPDDIQIPWIRSNLADLVGHPEEVIIRAVTAARQKGWRKFFVNSNNNNVPMTDTATPTSDDGMTAVPGRRPTPFDKTQIMSETYSMEDAMKYLANRQGE